jgi:hypothetical protein
LSHQSPTWKFTFATATTTPFSTPSPNPIISLFLFFSNDQYYYNPLPTPITTSIDHQQSISTTHNNNSFISTTPQLSFGQSPHPSSIATTNSFVTFKLYPLSLRQSLPTQTGCIYQVDQQPNTTNLNHCCNN